MTLTVTPNQFEAESIVNMLQLEGIRSMMRAADMISNSNGGLSGRMAVLVMPSDLEDARAILGSA